MSMGSGYASYDLGTNAANTHEIPVVRATAESLCGLANIVTREDYDKTDVIQVQWPYTGSRCVDTGTGYGGEVEGDFTFEWRDNICYAVNESVGGDYIVCTEHNNHVYTREANYHPDGGQIICPYPDSEVTSFIVALAPPGDNVKPEDFTAFHCSGDFGIQILPNVWHQPAIPCGNGLTLRNKQGSIHACVIVDTIKETNSWMTFEIPKPPRAP